MLIGGAHGSADVPPLVGAAKSSERPLSNNANGRSRPTAAIGPAELTAINLLLTSSAGSPLCELPRSLWRPLQLHAVGPRVEHIGWPASRLRLGYAVLATVVSA